MLQMRGDQGAVLVCAQEQERFCQPPHPCPRLSWLCSGCNAPGCNASDDRPSRCSACVRTGTWTLLSTPPPHPCPRPSWLCSGCNAPGCNASDERRSRCSACVHTGTCTLLSPPPPLPKTKLTLFRVQCSRVQCFRWEAIKVQCLCARRNMHAFVTPPHPCPRLSWLCSGCNAPGCNASDDRRSRCSACVRTGTWTLLWTPPTPAQD